MSREMESTPSTLKHSNSAPPRPRGPFNRDTKTVTGKISFQKVGTPFLKKDPNSFY